MVLVMKALLMIQGLSILTSCIFSLMYIKEEGNSFFHNEPRIGQKVRGLRKKCQVVHIYLLYVNQEYLIDFGICCNSFSME